MDVRRRPGTSSGWEALGPREWDTAGARLGGGWRKGGGWDAGSITLGRDGGPPGGGGSTLECASPLLSRYHGMAYRPARDPAPPYYSTVQTARVKRRLQGQFDAPPSESSTPRAGPPPGIAAPLMTRAPKVFAAEAEFLRWRLLCVSRKTTRKRMRQERGHRYIRAARFWIDRTSRRFWAAWKSHLRLALCIKRVRYRSAYRAWNAWVSLVSYRRDTQEKLAGALAKMANRDLAAAWNQWQENAQLQQATRRAVRRWVQACLAGAFLGWVDAVVHGQAMKEKLQGALAKLANREVAAAWNQWVELVEHSRATKEKLAGALAKMANRDLFAAWSRWLIFVQEKIEMVGKLSSAMHFWRNSALTLTWVAWMEFMFRKAMDFEKMHKAMKFMTNSCLCSAWATWRQSIFDRRLGHVHLERAMFFWRNQAMAGSFMRWCSAAADQSEMRQRLRKAISKFSERELSRAWNRWLESTLEKQALQQNIQKALARWRNSCQSSCFMKWLHEARINKALTGKLFTALQRMRSQELNRSWNAWVEYAVYRQQIVLALMRWKNGCLSKAWNYWVEWGQRKRRILMTIMGAKEHHMGDVLFRSWLTWLEILATRKRLEGGFSEIFNNATVRQLKGLLGVWRGKAVLQQKMAMAMARWRNKTIVPSFFSWVSFVHTAQTMRLKLRGALVRLAQRGMVASWNKWLEHVVMQQNVRRAALKWGNKALGSAWDRWREWLDERASAYERLGRAAAFWVKRSTVSAWNHWIEVIIEMQDRRSKLLGAFMKMTQRQLAAAWNTWIKAVADRNEMRAKLAGALRRMAQRELAAAWNTWQVRIMEARAAANAGVALKHWANRHLSSAFRTWTHWLQSQRSQVQATELALAFWMDGMMRNWWERWLQYVSGCIKEKAASLYSEHRLSKSIFAAWRFHVQHEARPQHELKEFSSAFGNLKLKQRSFVKWVGKSEHGVLARTGLMFHSRRSLIRGFEAWRVFAMSSTEERAFKYRLEALLGIGDAYSNFRRHMSPSASPRMQQYPKGAA